MSKNRLEAFSDGVQSIIFDLGKVVFDFSVDRIFQSWANEIVLDYYRLKPNETIFLDDNIENVRSAEGLGIKAILVSSQSQLNDELKKAGVLA